MRKHKTDMVNLIETWVFRYTLSDYTRPDNICTTTTDKFWKNSSHTVKRTQMTYISGHFTFYQ